MQGFYYRVGDSNARFSEGCHLCHAECRSVIYGRRELQNSQRKNDLNKPEHLKSAFSPGFYREPAHYTSIRRERPQVSSSG